MNRPNARSKHSRRWIWIERGIFLSSALSPPRTNHDQRLVVEKADKKARHPLGVPCSVPTCLERLLLSCHFEIDLCVLFSLHGDLLARFAEFLLPDFNRIGSRRHIGQLKGSGIIRHGKIRIGGCNQPTLHPSVNIASHFDGLGLIDFNVHSFFELRLSHIKSSVHLAKGVDIVQNPVGIHNRYSRTGGKHQNVGMIAAALLIQGDFSHFHFFPLEISGILTTPFSKFPFDTIRDSSVRGDLPQTSLSLLTSSFLGAGAVPLNFTVPEMLPPSLTSPPS